MNEICRLRNEDVLKDEPSGLWSVSVFEEEVKQRRRTDHHLEGSATMFLELFELDDQPWRGEHEAMSKIRYLEVSLPVHQL